jgi:hypothetical protein
MTGYIDGSARKWRRYGEKEYIVSGGLPQAEDGSILMIEMFKETFSIEVDVSSLCQDVTKDRSMTGIFS